MENIQGKNIRFIRNYLGLSRSEFAIWLSNLGIQGRESKIDGNKTYSTKTIEAWETGKRIPPPKVLAAIRDNCLWEGEKISWSYLTGESEYITYRPKGIVEHTFRITEDYQKNPDKWTPVDPHVLADEPINKFAVTLIDNILPALGYSKFDIIDWGRFTRYMSENIKKLIDDYIVMLNNDSK